MKKNILAICDSEQEYAYRLMDALSRRADFPFEIHTFTSTEKLRESLLLGPVQLLLIAQSVFYAEMKSWPIEQIILLQEEETIGDGSLPILSKYSSVTRIARKITEQAVEAGSLPPPVSAEHTIQFWGFYTPVGRCLQTTLALTAGQLLARSHRVLYLNFESCSGLETVLGRSFESEFSQLLYYLKEPTESFLGHLSAMAENVGGMDFMPGAKCGYDLWELSADEWLRLLDALRYSRYEYVILDLADGLSGLFEILRRCSRIFTIVREDGFGTAKMMQYEEALRQAEYTDVPEKTQKLKLPLFQRLPRDLNHLAAGELTDYAERTLFTDEQGSV